MNESMPNRVAQFKRLLESFDKTEPYLISLTNDQILVSKNKEAEIHQVCTGCREVIVNDWDHADWCALFKEEALVAFIKKGLEE